MIPLAARRRARAAERAAIRATRSPHGAPLPHELAGDGIAAYAIVPDWFVKWQVRLDVRRGRFVPPAYLTRYWLGERLWQQHTRQRHTGRRGGIPSGRADA